MEEECPYPGLAAFGTEDARWFFGRDALLAELTGLLAEPGAVVLVAGSGAGKSSLLRAGLIPALDRGALPQAGSRRWPRLLFTPTAHPLIELTAQASSVLGIPAERLSATLAGHPAGVKDLIREVVSEGQVPGDGVTVMVDQFEETFALCDDEAERAAFIEALCALGAADPPAGLVVLSMRADFYPQASDYPVLRAALRDRQVLIGPMSVTELRQVIVYPSQEAGLELEPGLAELLIRDLGGTRGSGSGYDAGRLPLLAHALRTTWQQRHGHILTVDGYVATGGIAHAIATSAERTFGRLDSDEQELARVLFLRMVRIGDRTEDIRRTVGRTDLISGSGSPAAAEKVLETFTRARLITHDRDAVEIAHEALLREWPRLRGWIDTDHAGRLVRQDIEEQAAGWEAAGQDASRLYRGTRLEAARTWAARAANPGELTTRSRMFLAASVRQKRRSARLRRGAIAALTALALAASLLAVVAILQRRSAIQDRDLANFNAVRAQAAGLTSTDPSLAAQLTLVAYRMRSRSDLYTSLINFEASGLATPLALGARTSPDLTYSPDGRVLVGAGGRIIQLWNPKTRDRPVPYGPPLPGIAATVNSVSISPDGRILAAGIGTSNGSSTATVRMWDISDPSHPAAIGQPLPIPGPADSPALAEFDPRGHVLFVWMDGDLLVWDVSQPAKPVPRGTWNVKGCPIEAVDFSPDGKQAAAGCENGQLYMEDIADPARPRLEGIATVSHAGQSVTVVAFSPDGRSLVSAAYDDQTFSLWDVTNPARPASRGLVTSLNNGIYWASFSPDGSVLATSDHDGTVQLWDVTDPGEVTDLGPPMTADAGPAVIVAFSPDGRTVASGYVDGSIRLWNVPHPMITTYSVGYAAGLAFSSDGSVLAASSSTSGALNLWEIGGAAAPRRAGSPVVCPGTGAEPIAFAPRGSMLAAGCENGVFRLWDTADPRHVTALSPPEAAYRAGFLAPPVNSLTFDRDGKILAAAGLAGVSLWNVADPAHPAEIGSVHPARAPFSAASISPDGRMLAVADAVGGVSLWNIVSPARPREIVSLTGPGQPVTSITFSHNGELVAAGSQDDNVYLWRATGRHPSPVPTTLKAHTDQVTGVAFSPGDTELASSSYDNTVRLWTIAPPSLPGTLGGPLTGHTDYALGVAFSPAGDNLASIGSDSAVHLWDLNVNDAIARICSATSGVLTPDVWSKYVSGAYSPPCS